ncbi:hypothetical protein [Salinivibrio socompensis]|uniref:hypothetical protein n=1 Tax=Salinivibrio socompensis TaxID=1510206 RepID=UPI0004AED3DB|nr:hypothetical protein [Salinivibrio socompensis]
MRSLSLSFQISDDLLNGGEFELTSIAVHAKIARHLIIPFKYDEGQSIEPTHFYQ